jgi:glycosyltransferase involved in cell wall biosynthesis
VSVGVPVTVIIHTLNEEVNLPYALDNVLGWADQVCVVDSASTDRTREIARERGVELYVRPCTRENLVAQRNWALDNIAISNDWVFILDADEYMEEELKAEVERVVCNDDGTKDGYWCRFKLIFMGRWLRRAGLYPTWSLRLFRHRVVRYERREVNAHPLVQSGREGYLQGHLIHEDRRGFSFDLRRIDEFSTLEARAYQRLLEGGLGAAELPAHFWGNVGNRRRFLKHLFIRLPARPFVIFTYLYIVRLGFLEGRPGLDYAIYKAVCEWATTVKMIESRRMRESKDKD